MRKFIQTAALAGMMLAGSGVFLTGRAQMGWGGNTGHGHGGGWSDSVSVEQRSGVVIVDSSSAHPRYYLDENGDSTADLQLMFGPYWYRPENGARRPDAGDTVAVTGTVYSSGGVPVFVVFTVNGLEWRNPSEITEHGWNPMGFWADTLQTVEVTGTVLVDTTYFVWHYFLDTNGDSLPEYMLNFGPYWYRPAGGAERPENGAEVTVKGGLHTGMFGTPAIMVYEINGQKWREDSGPGDWRGGWMHRSAPDSTFIFCSADSLSHVAFGPGAMMGGMMGQYSFPDSVFVQFERVHPDLMPGSHDSTFFMGFYMNVYDPEGGSMMMGGGSYGMHHGMMRFNGQMRFQFHYDESQVRSLGLDEGKIHLMAWNEDLQTWMPVAGASVDTSRNVITVTSDEAYSYFALASSPLTTGVHEGEGAAAVPAAEFALKGNYPNPFRMDRGAEATSIQYRLAVEADVSVYIFDLRGRMVFEQALGVQQPGAHRLIWNGRNMNGLRVSSGIYLVSLHAKGRVRTAKITVIR